MKIDRLRKARCMTLKRCSTPGQVDTSITNQIKNMEKVLTDNEITVAADIDLKGVSGSVPGNRNDIDDILSRKKYINDFDYLIVPSADRFTRAGAQHGQKLLWDLEIAEITVYFVQENIFSDSEMGRTYLGFLFDAAKMTAKQISKNTTEGNTYSFKDGKSPHTRCIPYGCDRLYSVDGKRLHILRNRPDGTQQMWSPEENLEERRLIRTFPANPAKGTKNHYHKQKSEIVTLIPGDPEERKVIELIMKRTWIEGVGNCALAYELNESGVVSPRGGQWSVRTVYEMARRPIYVGLAIRGRCQGGIYHCLNANGAPIGTNRKLRELANVNKVLMVRRPRADWIEREAEEFLDFLPQKIRDAARTGILNHLDRVADAPVSLAPARFRRANSPFLLTGILKAKDNDSRMVGVGARYRYYQTVSWRDQPGDPKLKKFSRCVPAEPLHETVLEILRSVMVDRPSLNLVVEKILDDQRQKAMGIDLKGAQKRIKAITARQVLLTKRISGDEDVDQPVLKALADTDRELCEIRTKIADHEQMIKDVPPADLLVTQFIENAAGIEEMTMPSLKRLLSSLIQSMVIDMDTFNIHMEMTLPSWTLNKCNDLNADVSTDATFTHHKRRYRGADLRPCVWKFSIQYHREHLRSKPYYTWERLDADSLKKAS